MGIDGTHIYHYAVGNTFGGLVRTEYNDKGESVGVVRIGSATYDGAGTAYVGTPTGLVGMTVTDRKGDGFQLYPIVVNAVDHKRLLLGWSSLYVSDDNGTTATKITTTGNNEENSGYNTGSNPSRVGALAAVERRRAIDMD